MDVAKNIRILIAEESAISQQFLLRIFDRLNISNVDVANDGEKACDRVKREAYDFILMDVNMPVMSGIDACKQIIKSTYQHPKPIVIFLTSHLTDALKAECKKAGGIDLTDALKAECKKAGGIDFLSKPITGNLSELDDCFCRHSRVDTFLTQADDLKTESPMTALLFLIAEDNAINQKVLCRILQRLQFTNFDVVADGKQACDKELDVAYDVILMDMQMPIMSGVDACKIIMNRETDHPKSKIVFETAHALVEFEVECREVGAVDFLTKPVTMSSIESFMVRLLTM